MTDLVPSAAKIEAAIATAAGSDGFAVSSAFRGKRRRAERSLGLIDRSIPDDSACSKHG
jgi:hypothetical protein